MAEHDRGKGQANGEAPKSTTEDVLETLLRHQKAATGDDDLLTNPELEQLIGNLKQGMDSAGRAAAPMPEAVSLLSLEELAAQTSVSLVEVPVVKLPAGDTGAACNQCGGMNPSSTRFCGSCGARLKERSPLAENRGQPAPVPAELKAVTPRRRSQAWSHGVLLVLLAGLAMAVYQQRPSWRPLLRRWFPQTNASPAVPIVPEHVVNAANSHAAHRAAPAANPAPRVLPPAAAASSAGKPAPPIKSGAVPQTRSSATVRRPLPQPAPVLSTTPVVEIPLPDQQSSTPGAEAPTQPERLVLSPAAAQRRLLHKVEPEYPRIARMARVQGSVVLQAVIGKDGVVEQLNILSGNPTLIPPAINAVKQWRYRPYLLNSEPVEIETTITLEFKGE